MVRRRSNTTRQKWNHLDTERSLNWGGLGLMALGTLLEMTGVGASVGIALQIAGAGMSFANTGVKQHYHQLGKGGLAGSYTMDAINIIGIGGTVAAARMIKATDIKEAEEGIDFAKGVLQQRNIDKATEDAEKFSKDAVYKAKMDRGTDYMKKVNEEWQDRLNDPVVGEFKISTKKITIDEQTSFNVDGELQELRPTTFDPRPKIKFQAQDIDKEKPIPTFKTEVEKESYYNERAQMDEDFNQYRYKIRQQEKAVDHERFLENKAIEDKYRKVVSTDKEIEAHIQNLSGEIVRKTRLVRYAIPGVKLVALTGVWGGNYKISKQYQD